MLPESRNGMPRPDHAANAPASLGLVPSTATRTHAGATQDPCRRQGDFPPPGAHGTAMRAQIAELVPQRSRLPGPALLLRVLIAETGPVTDRGYPRFRRTKPCRCSGRRPMLTRRSAGSVVTLSRTRRRKLRDISAAPRAFI